MLAQLQVATLGQILLEHSAGAAFDVNKTVGGESIPRTVGMEHGKSSNTMKVDNADMFPRMLFLKLQILFGLTRGYAWAYQRLFEKMLHLRTRVYVRVRVRGYSDLVTF